MRSTVVAGAFIGELAARYFAPMTVRTSINSGKNGASSARFRYATPDDPPVPGLVADDALDSLHVPETPELEALLDVDQLLAHVVGVHTSRGAS